MKSGKTTAAAAGIAFAILAGSCFTGIENTGRITDSDVRRRHASDITPEQTFLSAIASEPPSAWRNGKPFRVTDKRFSILLTPASASATDIAGRDILFAGFRPYSSITGTKILEATFTDSNQPADTFFDRPPMLVSAMDKAKERVIPFTVDLDLVARADSALTGRTLYIISPMWLDPADSMKACEGFRHIEVRVDTVMAGTDVYPLAVVFDVTDPRLAITSPRAIYMTLGNSRTATRNFETIFSFTNPRKRYPQVSDDVWELIIRSRVRKDMTRDECRLALGAPSQIERFPTSSGMAERWRYTDGVYLVFDDGYLVNFRL